MSERWADDVMEFRRALGLPVGTVPTHLPADASVAVIHEEYAELAEAMGAGDLPQVAKESCDLIVTVIGNCQRLGIDLRPVWDAVHRDNMAKVGGPVREDGKRLKPPGWVATPIAPILERQPPIGVEIFSTPERHSVFDYVEKADEWIARNGRKPAIGWYCLEAIGGEPDYSEIDELPRVVWDRLKAKPIHSQSGNRWNGRNGDDVADLRQALASLYRDGITPPELVNSGDAR